MSTDEWAASGAMPAAQARRWAAKAARLVTPLLELPEVPAAPSEVEVVAHDSVADGPYGALMLTWPEAARDRQLIHHLPDGMFFLRLLERVYAPVLDRRPHLRHLLGNRTRLEMAVTNDVLQVQLDPGLETYSMIRHHALMLFESTLWLDGASRAAWGELYEAVADLAMSARRNVPSRNELADIEAAGFDAMRRNGSLSADPDASEWLLDGPDLRPVHTYQLWATAAITVLWRDYQDHMTRRTAPEPSWHTRQLCSYRDDDYLTENLRTWL
ncbi:hypothetical protein [Nonomuraea sp. NPDC048916]|uniref:hypothetical protein n=1 Tax=Nonomuraea sp. NPDC048916 TaxID=3154232 RepID=UPI0033EF5EA3